MDNISSVLLQVKPAADLDPCLSSLDEVANKLKSFVLGEGNPLDGFLNKGELSQAAQISLSVLRSANEKNDCGKTLDPDVKKLVRSPLCKKMKPWILLDHSCRSLCPVSVA